MRKINLIGKFSHLIMIVDDDDFIYLSKYRWRGVERGWGKYKGKYEGVYAYNKIVGYAHRLIIKTPKGLKTDHKNGNTLDNRKSNLRICSHSQNMRNSNRKVSKTGYIGVQLDVRKKKPLYRAYIRLKGKAKHIGCFKTAKEAAIAHDEMMIKIEPEFSKLNFNRKRYAEHRELTGRNKQFAKRFFQKNTLDIVKDL